MVSRFSYIILSLCISLLVISCQQKTSEHHDSFLIFGTVVSVTLLDIDEKLAEDSFRSIRADLQKMHESWHVWEPGPLMRVNQLLTTQIEFSAAPSVLELFQIAKDLSIKSEGLFNPAIGKLIGLWGFHSHQQASIEPDKTAILDLVKQQPSMQDISLNGVRMQGHNPALKLDFGGVAKGLAIDRLLKALKEKGVNNALIDTGGDLKVIGQHGTRPWKIAIRDPRAAFDKKQNTNSGSSSGLVASIELKDNEAAFTSGDYERYLKNKNNNDKHLHHIIDPRTGYPAIGTQSVTVLHNDASTADAAATAIFIAGPTEWVKIAKAMGIKNVLLIDDKGDIHLSTSMHKRIKLLQQRKIIEKAEL